MIYDLVCIGNAPIDIIMHVDDEVLERFGFQKGNAHTITDVLADQLLSLNVLKTEKPGGAGANVAACFNSVGGRAAFIGKIGNDRYARGFQKGFEDFSVYYPTPPADQPNARIITMITKDKERTFAADFAASNRIMADDVDEDLIQNAKILYLDGYTLNHDHGIDVFRRAIEIAKNSGTYVALSLAAASIIERFGRELNEFIESSNLIFMNRQEIEMLSGNAGWRRHVETLQESYPKKVFAITLGEEGSLFIARKKLYPVPAPLQRKEIIDLNGAGDAFAAGTLKYISDQGDDSDINYEEAAKCGSALASVALVTEGARPVKEHNIYDLTKSVYQPRPSM